MFAWCEPADWMFVAGWRTGSHRYCYSFKACVGGRLLTQQWEAVICEEGGWGGEIRTTICILIIS